MEWPKNYVDLFEFGQMFGAIGEPAARIITKNLVSAISSIQDYGVLHRDIKDENILLNPKTLDIKVIIFQ